MAPSLKDVARLAGVNPSTASRAIRGDPTQRINAGTRERVLAAADTLGYRANYLGRGLRVRRTGTIGLVVPNLDYFTFVDITHGVQAAAIEQERSLLLVEVDQFAAVSSELPADELIYRRLVAEGRVDGLVIGSRTLPDTLVRRLAEHRFPMVLVNRRAEGIPYVTGCDEEAAALAARTLLEHGHRAIGVVGIVIPEEDVGQRRTDVFRETLTAHGAPMDDRLVVQSLLSDDEGHRAVRTLLARGIEPRPTALFIGSMSIALGVLEGIQAMGLQVPADMSVIAFPDHRIARFTNPPLTTITAGMFEMGREAGRLLLRIVDGDGEAGNVQLPHVPRIVDRGSVRRLRQSRATDGIRAVPSLEADGP